MQHSLTVDWDGADILVEQLTQYCIWLDQRLPDQNIVKEEKELGHLAIQGKLDFYFAYMKLVHEICRNRISYDCSQSAMKTLGLDTDII